MGNWKKFILIVSLLSLHRPIAAWAADNADTRFSLRGLSGIRLTVEPVNPEVKEWGLDRDQIIKDVALKLKLGGIHLLKKGPSLNVKLIGFRFRKSDVLVFTLQFDVFQDISLARNPVMMVVGGASTWSVTSCGISDSPSDVRVQLKKQAEAFIEAFKAVNP